MTRVIPDLLLERYRLGELPAPAHDAIAREAAADPAVGARLDALARSDAEIRDRYAPGVLARRHSPRRRSARALVLAGALTTAVVALIVAIPRPIVLSVASNIASSDETRIKGNTGRPALAVYRRTASGSERLADGDLVHAGDLLRIGYASGGRGYGVILSIDGTGAVTQHLPPLGTTATVLAPAGLTLLDSAYELDEAPRVERFYFVVGTRPFDAAPILAAARRAGSAPALLPLPPGLEQITFAVQKEVRK